jgi:hypothetical protein
MSAVMAVLRRVGKVAAGMAPAALVAGLGLPALGGLIFFAVLGRVPWIFEAGSCRSVRCLIA